MADLHEVLQVRGDFAELFEGGFDVIVNFLGENVGIGKVGGLFEAFVSERKMSKMTLLRLIQSIQPSPAKMEKDSAEKVRFQK